MSAGVEDNNSEVRYFTVYTGYPDYGDRESASARTREEKVDPERKAKRKEGQWQRWRSGEEETFAAVIPASRRSLKRE